MSKRLTEEKDFDCLRESTEIETASPGNVRFSLCNVDNKEVRKVCKRSIECKTSFQWEVKSLMGFEGAE